MITSIYDAVASIINFQTRSLEIVSDPIPMLIFTLDCLSKMTNTKKKSYTQSRKTKATLKPISYNNIMNARLSYPQALIVVIPIAFFVFIAADWNDPVRFISDVIGSVVGLALVFIVFQLSHLIAKSFSTTFKSSSLYKFAKSYGVIVLATLLIGTMFAFESIDKSIINHTGVSGEATVTEAYYTYNEHIAGIGWFMAKTNNTSMATKIVVKYKITSTNKNGTLDIPYKPALSYFRPGQPIEIKYIKPFPEIGVFAGRFN